MGWVDNFDGTHEGYLVAVVADGWRWRELQTEDGVQLVTQVQVACDCGWRSPRISAPFATRFMPSSVILPPLYEDDFDAAACKLWQRHVEEMRTAQREGRYFSNGLILPLHEERRARLAL